MIINTVRMTLSTPNIIYSFPSGCYVQSLVVDLSQTITIPVQALFECRTAYKNYNILFGLAQ